MRLETGNRKFFTQEILWLCILPHTVRMRKYGPAERLFNRSIPHMSWEMHTHCWSILVRGCWYAKYWKCISQVDNFSTGSLEDKHLFSILCCSSEHKKLNWKTWLSLIKVGSGSQSLQVIWFAERLWVSTTPQTCNGMYCFFPGITAAENRPHSWCNRV